MAFRIRKERRPSSRDRVPAVAPGTAIIYTRYEGEEKSVVMNPADFHQLAALDDDLAELAAERAALGDLAVEALLAEATPGTAIEDPAEIEAILGL